MKDPACLTNKRWAKKHDSLEPKTFFIFRNWKNNNISWDLGTRGVPGSQIPIILDADLTLSSVLTLHAPSLCHIKKFNSNFIYLWSSFQHFCILVPPFSKIVGNSFSVRLSGFDSLTYQSSTIFSALRIHVSPECKEVLDRLGGYVLQERGFVEMKVSERLSILHDQIF